MPSGAWSAKYLSECDLLAGRSAEPWAPQEDTGRHGPGAAPYAPLPWTQTGMWALWGHRFKAPSWSHPFPPQPPTPTPPPSARGLSEDVLLIDRQRWSHPKVPGWRRAANAWARAQDSWPGSLHSFHTFIEHLLGARACPGAGERALSKSQVPELTGLTSGSG